MRKAREIIRPLVIAGLMAAALGSVSRAEVLDVGKEKNTCRRCHQAVENVFKDSVHKEYAVACVDCHGGNPMAVEKADSMNPAAGFIGKPTPSMIPGLCAKCHANYSRMRQYGIATDQFEAYKTSVHGKKLLGEGNQDAAQCVSCHGAHEVVKTSDPRSHVYATNVPGTCAKCHSNKDFIAKYGYSTDVVAEYKESIHGKRLLKDMDTAAPSCVSCHGNHGAAPPGVDEVVNICGKCHGNTRDYFVKSKHYSEGIKCIQCHSNHLIKHPTFAMYARNVKGGCRNCHKDNSKAGKYISDVLLLLAKADDDIVAAKKDVASALSTGAEGDAWLETLIEAKTAMVKIGPIQHQFDYRSVEKVINNEAIIKAQSVQKEIEGFKKEEKDKFILCAAFALYVSLFIALLYAKYWVLKRRWLKDIAERKARTAV